MQAQEGDKRSERPRRRIFQDRSPRQARHGGTDRVHGRGRDAGGHPASDTPPKGGLGCRGETTHAKV